MVPKGGFHPSRSHDRSFNATARAEEVVKTSTKNKEACDQMLITKQQNVKQEAIRIGHKPLP